MGKNFRWQRWETPTLSKRWNLFRRLTQKMSKHWKVKNSIGFGSLRFFLRFCVHKCRGFPLTLKQMQARQSDQTSVKIPTCLELSPKIPFKTENLIHVFTAVLNQTKIDRFPKWSINSITDLAIGAFVFNFIAWFKLTFEFKGMLQYIKFEIIKLDFLNGWNYLFLATLADLVLR